VNLAERIRLGTDTRRAIVHCLGRFRLQDSSGNQLVVRTRKARALVSALAVSRRPMSRDCLATLLWSDRGDPQARASLRQTIFELQHCGGGEPFVLAARDDISIRSDLLVTDIDLIREASAENDWQHLLHCLQQAEPGLLSDLDGLDEEFDSWLRNERARNPGEILAVALEAAERCIAADGPRAALEIVSEVLRLDPVSEEATRLAMRIDKQLGDSDAIHRHFQALKSRLRNDLDAGPAPETIALLSSLTSGLDEPVHSQAVAETMPAVEVPAARHRGRLLLACSGALLLLIAFAAIFLPRLISRPAPAGPIVLAVLPFEHDDRRDPWLAEGLWDDTRAALSHNSAIRVLGRTTTTSMAARKLSPDQYRRRLGVAYILEGVVRRNGDQVLVSTSLTSTSDGVAIWEDSFRARLGDPLALQEAIANGIEGKLRGRLAPGGGARADQIATTPEVYALYSQARSLLRDRSSDSALRAQLLARKALALDPNYAPAWAVLAETMHFSDFGYGATADRRSLAIFYARRAIALAPRLAQAHATLGFFLGQGSPAAERELRLAVALDPNHVEAWNWLGGVYSRQFRYREAANAFEQAVVIDPIWAPAVVNLADTYSEIGDQNAFERLVSKVQRAGGDENLVAALRISNAASRGDLSAAGQLIRQLEREDRLRGSALFEGAEALTQLGYFDEAARLAGYPKSFGAILRSERLPSISDGYFPVAKDADFWLRQDYGTVTARAMVNLGRDGDLLKIYRGAFVSPDDAIEQMTNSGLLVTFAPTIAIALQRSGDTAEAERLLNASARLVEPAATKKGQSARDAAWALGRIQAAQGRDNEALQLIAKAIAAGWLPNGLQDPVDIAQDPALRALRGDPRFEALRKRLLDHIARERAELGPIEV
jgi:DNA-binding SARP family transcriptional activator/TolB-like protein/Flp pilus assembly protein TadD